MHKGPIRYTLLAGALAASAAASAWAVDQIRDSSLVPQWRVEERTVTRTEVPAAEPQPIATERVVTTTTEVPVEQSLTPGERLAQPDAVVVYDSGVPRQPPITITEPRLTLDERIRADVIDALARSPYSSGQVQVVSVDQVVTLSGWTTTAGQAWRAGRDAARVHGVRYVVNEIRPRVGPVTG